MQATHLKNQAAQARRTGTALNLLARQLVDLSDADNKILQRAATILSAQGNKVSRVAVIAKRKEEAKEKAILEATVEVTKFIETWPTETLLDKVALICANRFGSDQLRDYLSTKKPDELDWYINEMSRTAKRDMISDAAYKLAGCDNKSIVDVIERARQQLEKYRTSGSTKDLVNEYQTRMS